MDYCVELTVRHLAGAEPITQFRYSMCCLIQIPDPGPEPAQKISTRPKTGRTLPPLTNIQGTVAILYTRDEIFKWFRLKLKNALHYTKGSELQTIKFRIWTHDNALLRSQPQVFRLFRNFWETVFYPAKAALKISCLLPSTFFFSDTITTKWHLLKWDFCSRSLRPSCSWKTFGGGQYGQPAAEWRPNPRRRPPPPTLDNRVSSWWAWYGWMDRNLG